MRIFGLLGPQSLKVRFIQKQWLAFLIIGYLCNNWNTIRLFIWRENFLKHLMAKTVHYKFICLYYFCILWTQNKLIFSHDILHIIYGLLKHLKGYLKPMWSGWWYQMGNWMTKMFQLQNKTSYFIFIHFLFSHYYLFIEYEYYSTEQKSTSIDLQWALIANIYYTCFEYDLLTAKFENNFSYIPGKHMSLMWPLFTTSVP